MTWFHGFLQQDAPPLLAGMFAAIACALCGSFLVLRRMSLMGDAISHAVLPGIVAAFLLSDSLATLPVFIGAAAVGVLTSLLSELVHRVGRVEPGASMGVVFTILFSIGVIWLEQIGGRSVHLDADCVLYGNMQNAIWPEAPTTLAGLFSLEALSTLPHAVQTLAIAVVVNIVLIVLFFKELRLSAFDPTLAKALGYRPALMHAALMTLVAITTVAAFEAVGSILVVAMLIVPGVVGHLFCDRLGSLLIVATLAAILASAGGYAAGAVLNLDTTGMVGVMLGIVLIGAGLIAPKHGWLARWFRRLRLRVATAREDMLGALWRLEELPTTGDAPVPAPAARELKHAVGGGFIARLAFHRLLARGEAVPTGKRGRVSFSGNEARPLFSRFLFSILRGGGGEQRIALTEAGRTRARGVVRAHRLWETYLVKILGLRPDHVHDTAMTLEHITDDALRERLAKRVDDARTDPHGSAIPEDRG